MHFICQVEIAAVLAEGVELDRFGWGVDARVGLVAWSPQGWIGLVCVLHVGVDRFGWATVGGAHVLGATLDGHIRRLLVLMGEHGLIGDVLDALHAVNAARGQGLCVYVN